ncbi:MAG: hypothetical protein H6978_10795 [Gammaproteobacteria bacterium]|nr:hypothetical protein [Gammaproteobacteria bacterium]
MQHLRAAIRLACGVTCGTSLLLAGMQSPAAAQAWVVNLMSVAASQKVEQTLANPVAEDAVLYQTEFSLDGKAWRRYRLGIFTDKVSAQRAIAIVQDTYPGAWLAPADEADMRAIAEATAVGMPVGTARGATVEAPAQAHLIASVDSPGDVIVTATEQVFVGRLIPVATSPAAIEPSLGLPPVGLIEEQMEEARVAMVNEDFGRAIALYTRVTEYPAHASSADALELLGLARERNGQVAQAKRVYEQYLATYPEGDGTERVRQRLRGLITASMATSTARRRQATDVQAREVAQGGLEKSLNGSLSQFFWYDAIDIQGRPTEAIRTALVTNLDLAGRLRNDKIDFQSRISGGYIWNMKAGSSSDDRLSYVYVDLASADHSKELRLGRQSRYGEGVFGRFDGIRGSLDINEKFGVNAVAGAPVYSSYDGFSSAFAKYFFGTSLDWRPFGEAWDFNVYFLEQHDQGVVDRRAVGSEVRYQRQRRSLHAQVDYDIFYNTINTVLLRGNYSFESGTSVNLNFDYRKAPILSATNALTGQGFTSLEEALTVFNPEEIRQLALDRTASLRTATVGFSHRFNPRLQLTGDVTVFKYSGTPGSGGVDATEGTGYQYMFSSQLIASNVLFDNDTASVGLRYFDYENANTILGNAYMVIPLAANWRFNPRVLVGYRESVQNVGQLRFRPSMRTSYRWKRDVQFELEAGADMMWQDVPVIGKQRTTLMFAYLGYRWQFY